MTEDVVIPYAAYKVVHYLGIFTLVVVLSASLARSAQGGAAPDPWRNRLGILHGVALFAILLGGFGMLARLDLGFPLWIVAKLAIWLVAGALIVLRKSPAAAGWALAALPVLAVLAGWLAYVKPF